MSVWRESWQPALKTEEAALLPALPRHATGGAALKNALMGSGKTEKIQLAKPAPAAAVYEKQAGKAAQTAAFPGASALRHALGKRKKEERFSPLSRF